MAGFTMLFMLPLLQVASLTVAEHSTGNSDQVDQPSESKPSHSEYEQNPGSNLADIETMNTKYSEEEA